MPVPSTMMVFSDTSVRTPERARGLGAGAHHRHRPDGHHQVGLSRSTSAAPR
jgi:hypothetical protein